MRLTLFHGLRSFILDLAVRAKLIEQDSKDELASELLKRNQAERETGWRSQKLDFDKTPLASQLRPDEMPSLIFPFLGVDEGGLGV